MGRVDRARWAAAKTVFHEALDTPRERRAAFVAAACGTDGWLRDEVNSLLDSDNEAGQFIEQPATVLLAYEPRGERPRLFNPGNRLGRYEITAFLGAGAVSEVYRARDTRLGRTVAVKLLTDTSAPDAGAWLLREAQHASTLNHPHVCTVHEVEEVDGLPFIVLEHIEGTTLHALVRTGTPVAGMIVRWGAQIADALDHAHRRGVIHRDLKGSNVVVTPAGDIKVLDFGLARRLSAHAAGDGDGDTEVLHKGSTQRVLHGSFTRWFSAIVLPQERPSRTVVGTTAENRRGERSSGTTVSVLTDASVAGTLTHIAPEVFEGGPIDARVDIWALGVMLYEMACGQLPFKGETPFSTANAILEAEPAPLPASVPVPLQRVIARCLSKDPGARYQTALDVRTALAAVDVGRRTPWTRTGRARAWALAAGVLIAAVAASAVLLRGWPSGATSADPAARMVAVLPLHEDGAGPSPPFLADGMTEALIAELGRFDALQVIAPTTTTTFRDRANAVRDVARETRAAHVLEGSITRANNRVRLSARLIEAATGRLIWSDEYERHVRDLQALYGSVAAAVAGAVEVNVGEDDLRRLALTRAVDPDVYEAYLKGRYYWNLRTSESLATAITHLEAAIALDPSYAPAYAALADCYNQLGTVMVGGGSPQQWRPRAADAAIKALQIDPGLAEAHATLGYVRHYNWEWDAADQSLRRAIALNPSYALGRIWYANLLSSRGRTDDAIREVTLAQELDPLSPVVNTNVAWMLIHARRYDDAIAQLKHTLAIDPAYAQAHSRLGAAYSLAGRHQDAVAAFETLVGLSGRSPSSVAALAEAYAGAGRHRDAEQLLDELIAARSTHYVSAGALANAYTALGRTETALTWLEQSFEERTNNIAYLAVEPVYDRLRHEARFQALLRAAGLP
jgi:eukaryotic-like serine/threonine-protein kinase